MLNLSILEAYKLNCKNESQFREKKQQQRFSYCARKISIYKSTGNSEIVKNLSMTSNGRVYKTVVAKK